MTATLTRRYRFSASHRLHSADLTAAENAALYGKCNNRYGHGHDYGLEVRVSGRINNQTGLLVHLESLDRLVYDQVLALFDRRHINSDIPEFANLVPTTENVASVIANILARHWTEYISDIGARLHAVHIQETERNGFTVLIVRDVPEYSRETELASAHSGNEIWK